MLSGGSLVSVSVTWAANTVTTQFSLGVKSVLGLMVNVSGPPLTIVSATLRVPEVLQTIWNQLPVTLTFSEKVILMSVVLALSPVPSTGVVLATVGGASKPNVKTWSAGRLLGGSLAS